MRTVFLDSVGLLALWNKNDQWHAVAEPAWNRLLAKPCKFVTTTGVLLECGNASARKPYRRDVVHLRQELLKADNLIEPTDEDVDKAWNAYASGQAGDAGIVDQISIAVLRRLQLNEVFTNDRHFRDAGFRVLF